MKRSVLVLAAVLLAGCGDSSSGRNDYDQQPNGDRGQPPAAAARPLPPPRPPTPEEAMELDLATPLAPAVEHWIADTELGDAWKEAKGNVADLRARLVADYKARQESGVGDTPSSLALRKDYDRWLAVHDRLKAFVLDCRAANEIRDLPPDLAKHFKNWSALRRELLRDAPAALDKLDADLSSARDAFAKLKDSVEQTDAKFATAETIDSRVSDIRAKAESIRSGAGEISRRYATDDEVAAIAERAAEAAADAKALAAKTAELREKLHDADAVRLFSDKVEAFERGAASLDGLIASKATREAKEKALSEAVTEDIRAKNFASLPAHRAALAALRAAADAARGEERECAAAVKAISKDFSGTLGAKAVRAQRQTLVSEASFAEISALSKRAETVAARYGKTLEAALNNLQSSAFKLEDGASETAALAEAEKRLVRLDALSKR